jgi:hypothetical protein
VSPGSHGLRVEKDGFRPFELRVSVEAGRVVRTEVMLVAIERPRPAPTGSRLNVLPWIVGGVGVVGIVTGTVFGILALGQADAANEEVAGDFDLWNDASNDAETFALVADVSFGVGILAGVGALVLFLIGSSSDHEAPEAATSLQLYPVVGTRGAGLALGGEL